MANRTKASRGGQPFFPFRLAATALAVLSALSPQVHAVVQTDGTAGAAQTLAGPNYVIPQSLGTVAGNNLFHSFHTFGIAGGQSATFNTSVSGNVISRVTGGAISQINGPINLNAGGATPAFWFINPAGVVFGAGAAINVPGAFHVSTADYVGFADGNRFYASLANSSSFTAATPESFGFLGDSRAGLIVRDGAILQNVDQQISLVAGDVLVDDAEVRTRAGDIRIVALGQRAEEVLPNDALPFAEGTLDIVNNAVVQALADTASDGGSVAVAAGDVFVENAILRARSVDSGNSGTLQLEAGSLTINNDSRIGSGTYWDGDAGNVTVLVRGDIFLGGGSMIVSNTEGSGRAGDLFVSAGGSLEVIGSGNWISSDTFESGDAGNVDVQANSLYIDAYGGQSGVSSESYGVFASGHSGLVSLNVAESTELRDGGRISSSTSRSGHAGLVSLSSGSLLIDGTWAGSAVTGIVSNAAIGSTGDSGAVFVSVLGDAILQNGGVVSSSSKGEGAPGWIDVRANRLQISGTNWFGTHSAISSDAGLLSEGVWAAYVGVTTVGDLELDAGGQISTKSDGAFNAGNIDVAAGGVVSLSNGASISSNANDRGAAGNVYISASALHMSGTAEKVYISSDTSDVGNAGSVTVEVSGNVVMLDETSISSNSNSIGAGGWAGGVFVTAGALQMSSDNLFYRPVISSDTQGVGDAGIVVVNVQGGISMLNSSISSDSYGPGLGGDVRLTAASLSISGGYISSDAVGSGDAGNVRVEVSGDTAIRSGAWISSDTYDFGNAGDVFLSSGSLLIDGGGMRTGVSSEALGGSSGNAGSLIVEVAGNTDLRDRGQISSSTYSVGNAGNVNVRANGTLSLLDNAWISSDTWDWGNAGEVTVRAGNLLIDAQGDVAGISSEALADSIGNAAQVTVSVTGTAELRAGAQISSSAYGWGAAGQVSTSTANLIIDGAGSGPTPTGILSKAGAGAGDAGYVIVEAPGSVRVVNGGEISSSTASAFGAAGVVMVVARDVTVDGAGSNISARAEAGSSGNTGYVAVVPSSVYGWTPLPIETDQITISNGGEISIANHAIGGGGFSGGFINLSAKNISIINGQVTANSTGNFAASDININFAKMLFVDPSQISTSSVDGDGGNITIQGGDVVWLDRSQITTSVTGISNGNGGDISISAGFLILNNGFIQANTEAPASSGGDIAVNVTALIPSYSSLLVGGAVPLMFDSNTPGYNVIQAAAPDGISGNIEITSPSLDLAGSMADIKAQNLQGGGLGRSPCDTTAGSSLAAVGHGGLPSSARDALRVEASTAASAPAISAAQPASPDGVQIQLAQASSVECRI